MVQEALANADGPQVVTIYGPPGMGKSSLAKFVALQYGEQSRQDIDVLSLDKTTHGFRDGVRYQFCGPAARGRIKLLQKELEGSLRYGSGMLPRTTEASSEVAEGQAGESSYQVGQARLFDQHLLVVLDDVHETQFLEELLVPANGVKYLVTSQFKDISNWATKIRVPLPTPREIREILVNCSLGVPTEAHPPEVSDLPLASCYVQGTSDQSRLLVTCKFDLRGP